MTRTYNTWLHYNVGDVVTKRGVMWKVISAHRVYNHGVVRCQVTMQRV